MPLATKLVLLAQREVGVHEIGDTNRGPRVNEYKAACEGMPSEAAWPWCAAFLCWLVREAMGDVAYSFRRPITPGAWDLERWSLEQDNSTQTKKPTMGDIRAGDLIIFKFSHCGLALSSPGGMGTLRTIEGNTNEAGSRDGGGVYLKHRPVEQIRSRIRFTV